MIKNDKTLNISGLELLLLPKRKVDVFLIKELLRFKYLEEERNDELKETKEELIKEIVGKLEDRRNKLFTKNFGKIRKEEFIKEEMKKLWYKKRKKHAKYIKNAVADLYHWIYIYKIDNRRLKKALNLLNKELEKRNKRNFNKKTIIKSLKKIKKENQLERVIRRQLKKEKVNIIDGGKHFRIDEVGELDILAIKNQNIIIIETKMEVNRSAIAQVLAYILGLKDNFSIVKDAKIYGIIIGKEVKKGG